MENLYNTLEEQVEILESYIKGNRDFEYINGIGNWEKVYSFPKQQPFNFKIWKYRIYKEPPKVNFLNPSTIPAWLVTEENRYSAVIDIAEDSIRYVSGEIFVAVSSSTISARGWKLLRADGTEIKF